MKLSVSFKMESQCSVNDGTDQSHAAWPTSNGQSRITFLMQTKTLTCYSNAKEKKKIWAASSYTNPGQEQNSWNSKSSTPIHSSYFIHHEFKYQSQQNAMASMNRSKQVWHHKHKSKLSQPNLNENQK